MRLPTEQTESNLREQLRGLRIDPPVEGFETALHRRLVEVGPPDVLSFWHRPLAHFFGNWRLLWPAAGAAVGLAVVLAMAVVTRTSTVSIAGIAVPSTKVAIVRVNLNVDVAVANADIKVQLPEGLVFWSDGQPLAQREFEWKQPLAVGDNYIPIAVRGERPGKYKMIMSAHMGEEQVNHEVVLEVIGG